MLLRRMTFDLFPGRCRSVLVVRQHGSQQTSSQPPNWSHHRADHKRSTANCAKICHCVQKYCNLCQWWCTVLPTTETLIEATDMFAPTLICSYGENKVVKTAIFKMKVKQCYSLCVRMAMKSREQ